MKKFTSIGQYRNVIHTVRTQHDFVGKDETGEPVYNHGTPYPTLTFHGTCKLHGTNSGICRYKDGRTEFQSRENVLDLEHDNAGFYAANAGKDLDFLFEGIPFEDHICVYGEWCGGSIQKGVALNGLPKMLVLFAVKVDGEYIDFRTYGRSKPEINIYNIEDFKTWDIEIDFNQPEYAQNKIIEWTMEVEEKCPVGMKFGCEGIGEGIVFKCVHNGQTLFFKSKGELHAKGSKVKILLPIDVEKLENINQLVELVLTASRLQQGFQHLKDNGKPCNQSSTGDYIRWVMGDIIKEESDRILANGFPMKDLNGPLSKAIRTYYFNNMEG